MIDLDKLRADLERDEGRRRFFYIDTMGLPTIGCGRNLRDKGLSEVEIDFLRDNDIADVTAYLDRVLPWWRNLPEPAARGLANLTFDLNHKILDFVRMLAALQAGDGMLAAAELRDSTFAIQTGARADRIAELFRQAFAVAEA